MICEGCKDLIVTIVKKGWADQVMQAARNAGSEGGTVLMGRGTGIHEMQSFLGIPIEPEKEIVLIVVEPEQTDRVLDAISAAAELDQPGRGIAFVIPLSRVAGRVHMLRKNEEQERGP
ncbi:MAG TPA: P-II family nitrogen regulator [Methanofollis liminatans]|uniref:P-II family nitrogen regulator n=1 Tax=Methanofollis liminatans TaxID=2201 RepID=A0A831PND2_9EURY|nr:P-II family nitrogen regulator [Methanofollis liminatans]